MWQVQEKPIEGPGILGRSAVAWVWTAGLCLEPHGLATGPQHDRLMLQKQCSRPTASGIEPQHCVVQSQAWPPSANPFTLPLSPSHPQMTHSRHLILGRSRSTVPGQASRCWNPRAGSSFQDPSSRPVKSSQCGGACG